MPLEIAPVTDQDRKDFQRWLKVSRSRYTATSGIRDRPQGLRSDHARITSGSVDIGNDLRESVPRALAALALCEKRGDDALAFLRPWVGLFQDVAEEAVARLNRERDLLQRLGVFGLWCEDDGCRKFIQPVAVRLTSTPTHSFATSAVCPNCRCVTVIWADDQGYWVRSAPELKEGDHPMKPYDIYGWLERVRPPRTRQARPIAIPH